MRFFHLLSTLLIASVAFAAPDRMHEEAFAATPYPSATECRPCHERQFEEWAVSQHAYAMMSPVFVSMQKSISRKTNGTNGDFCIRCHNPIGIALGEKIDMPSLDRLEISLEGVTCVVCHRVNEAYGKISGRTQPLPGPLEAPISGPTGNAGLEEAFADARMKLQTDGGRGRVVHAQVEPFFELRRPGFCGTCHDVNQMNGFRLEEAFSDFKHSPAAKKGISCQDCHMASVPGKPSPYQEGPAAVVGGIPTRTRRITNHFFAGPDHSAIHPGLFPFNPEARELATPREWLEFDHEAGWGTWEFEENVTDDTPFPQRWELPEERESARLILEDQFERLAWARGQRLEVLRNGIGIGDLRVRRSRSGRIEVSVQVKNLTEGHTVPTGFIAERLFWLHVVVRDRRGRILFQSGDLDGNGDLRDSHSRYVRLGLAQRDHQLFNLQSLFLTRNQRGGDRHQILPINVSADPLPFLRPSTFSASLTGRPAGARIHRQVIPPLESRWARYQVPLEDLDGQAPYRVRVELKAGMVPVHLVEEISDAGFDYGLSAARLARGIVAGHLVLDEKEAVVPR